MPVDALLIDLIIILSATVICVPLCQRLRVGAVVGYLVAGLAVGPFGFGLVEDRESIHILAELGVAFLLFAVGLELPISRLRVMPIGVFALGIAQVLVTGAAIGAVAIAFGAGLGAAVVIGGGLALSSTAILLVILASHGELTTRYGRAAITVLLIQDLAAAALLVVVVTLGRPDTALASSMGFALLKMAAAVVLVVVGGRLVLRPIFRVVAETRVPEAFAALTLLVVLATGVACYLAGLSLAFGAFLAGMLLADTQYRHQVDAEVRPFRGLLLGLFFVTVGMSMHTGLLIEAAPIVLAVAVGLLLGKAVILLALARIFGLPTSHAVQLGITLSQGSEFTFVLLGAGMANGLLPAMHGQILVLAVGITMGATPVIAHLGRVLALRIRRGSVIDVERPVAGVEDLKNHVVIAGFGRVGQGVARRLRAEHMPFVAVDLDPRNVAPGRERGLPVFYGDATRPEVLEAVHVERASAAVVALDDPRAALQVVTLLKYIFPSLPVHARARDDEHAQALSRAGADTVVPEVTAASAGLVRSFLGSANERDAPSDRKVAV